MFFVALRTRHRRPTTDLIHTTRTSLAFPGYPMFLGLGCKRQNRPVPGGAVLSSPPDILPEEIHLPVCVYSTIYVLHGILITTQHTALLCPLSNDHRKATTTYTTTSASTSTSVSTSTTTSTSTSAPLTSSVEPTQRPTRRSRSVTSTYKSDTGSGLRG